MKSIKKSIIKSVKSTLFLFIFFTLILQIAITYLYTNTKEFSIRALIRNISIAIAIYFVYKNKNAVYLLFPILLEVVLEFLKFYGLHIDKYIATKYQYNDYWRNINENNNIFSNFSEGIYDNILGFDTRDYSNENLKNIMKWCEKIYNDSIESKIKPDILIDINGKQHERVSLKKQSDEEKFKLICNTINLKPNMRVLEIGFGEGDLLKYIKNNYNINPVGVSISSEQVKLAKQNGFEAYTMDFWKMNKEELGTFDVIIQCGNIEYVRCTSDKNNIYEDFFQIINNILNKNGKYFITGIAFNEKFNDFYTYHDLIKSYCLWAGNDGCYPDTVNTYSKCAENVGFKTIYDENRTSDYNITSIIFMSYLQCMKNSCVNSISLYGVLDAIIKTIAAPYFLHTYMCYTPVRSVHNIPWNWQFIPQEKNGKMISPVELKYLCFQK